MTNGGDHKPGGEVVFQPTARLLRLLGEELISDEIIAVAELVKNAHDADATRCVLHFGGVTGPEGTITIEDNGHGMGAEEFLYGWMQPGASRKRQRKRQTTRRGRRVLGEKGVGRFAVDKLARRLELVSRRRGSGREIHAEFCWDDYDDESRLLSEITTRWDARLAREIAPAGTILRLRGLRTRWNERMFRRLCTRLARLVSPFRVGDQFQIVIDTDEFPDYSGEQRTDFLCKAPYQLQASFDGDEGIELYVGDRKSREIWPGPGRLTCGPARVNLYAFDLETPGLARIGPGVEVRAWLREWSGVSVYRDGFRVWPYGEPHDDWLGLDQRRVNNPVVRLSNNQVIGFVAIGRDTNLRLLDQTNREGLIHNDAFADLRRLVHFLFLHLEEHRQSIRHPRADGHAPSAATATAGLPLEALDRLAAALPTRVGGQLRKIRKDLEREIGQREEAHRRELQGHVELAASGQLLPGLVTDLRAALGPVKQDGLKRLLEFLERHSGELRSPLRGKARRRTVDLEGEVRHCLAVLGDRAARQGITVEVAAAKGGKLPRAELRPENVRRLVLLLFDYAARRLADQDKRRLAVHVWATEERAGMDFGLSVPANAAERAAFPSPPERGLQEWPGDQCLRLVAELCSACGGLMSLWDNGAAARMTLRLDFRRKIPRATT
jgi:hypothetical protein